ncbi:MAG TPA: peptidoglycan-binding protein, partial [Holophagaceae bacterium]|nr:peptidoglycan-binding protein [Holophagaceae bacterium]
MSGARPAVLAAALLCLLSPGPAVAAQADPALAAAIHVQLALRPWSASPAWRPMAEVYRKRADAPCWVDAGRPGPRVPGALATLRGAEEDGLHPQDYGLDWLEAESQTLTSGSAGGDAARLARFDVRLSAALTRLMEEVHAGRVAPATVGLGLDGAPDGRLPALTAEALLGDTRAAYREALPRAPIYARLRAALLRHRQLAREHPASRLPPLRGKLRPGQRWEGVPALAAWLQALGDLPPEAAPKDDLYEGALVAAVQRFQARHGLGADGTLGAQTCAALAVRPETRVAQLELGLERLRWVDGFLQAGPIVGVNIPQFTLWARGADTAQAPLRMRVVVGRAFRKWRTPVFRGTLSSVLFSPPWEVPRSIAVEE